MPLMYLCVLDLSADRCGATGQGATVATLWVGHKPTILAAQVHLPKLCFSPTWYAHLRLDHLSEGKVT